MTFHSKEKQFLCLHPTSVYSARPELLIQDPSEKKERVEGRSENSKELLAFVTLLETNKPYIMNSMRVPVLQTLLLFSSNLDTNSDCTRVICDWWIDLSFKDGEKAQQLLSDVIKLRTAWNKLLELRLSTVELPSENKRYSDQIWNLQRSLSRKLAEFIDSNIQYRYKRISSTETSYLYVTSLPRETEVTEDDGTSADAITENVTSGNITSADTTSAQIASEEVTSSNAAPQWLPLDDGVPHPTKGGLRVTDYMTYGCVRDDLSVAVAKGQAEYLREHYHCPLCGEHLICNILERLQHDSGCHSNHHSEGRKESSDAEEKTRFDARGENIGAAEKVLEDAKEKSRDDGKQSANVPLKTEYYCSVCERKFDFTPVETLKHKRSHK